MKVDNIGLKIKILIITCFDIIWNTFYNMVYKKKYYLVNSIVFFLSLDKKITVYLMECI